ncbi:hypothetical protein [Paenibacillus polymyxa]|uniref:hypothetical protein n=1 Tax=Paenibacillus polymyxa TaxID=1406 RepID=UPI002ED22B56|nr:hypothetical protein [Paenibacillus polymyxa]
MSEFLSKTEMYIERARFQELVHRNFGEMNLDKNIFKGVANFIYSTLIIGFFFSWASASDTSNIFLFLNNVFESKQIVGQFFYITFHILFMIPMIALLLDIRNSRRAVIINSLAHTNIYRIFYREFIIGKLTNKKYSELRIDEKKELFLSNQGRKVEFEYYEFENYITERLSKPIFNISGFFPSSYANFILLNECIDGTLIMERYGHFGKYGELIDENYHLM